MITLTHTDTGLLISGHGTAQIVAPHDAPALARAIRRIIARPTTAAQLPTPAMLGVRLAKARASYLVT